MIRYGHSWPTGRGRRSWISMPIGVPVVFWMVAWPFYLCFWLIVAEFWLIWQLCRGIYFLGRLAVAAWQRRSVAGAGGRHALEGFRFPDGATVTRR